MAEEGRPPRLIGLEICSGRSSCADGHGFATAGERDESTQDTSVACVSRATTPSAAAVLAADETPPRFREPQR
jgi:hypothetical protein